MENLLWAAHLASIVDTSDDAIVSKSLNGIVLSWNKAAQAMFGYDADEMIGSSILRIIPKDRADEEQKIIAKIANGERIQHYETVRVTKSGKHLDVSVRISPIRDATGAIVGASKIIRDMTLQNAHKAELEKGRRAILLSQLTAGLAHDFINSLTVVSGSLQLIDHDELSEPERKLLVSAEQALDVAAHIARRFSNLGKDQDPELVPLKVSEVLKSFERMMRSALRERCALSIATDPATPLVYANRVNLNSAIINLVLNSRDAMTSSMGEIDISCRPVTCNGSSRHLHGIVPPGIYSCITVRDNGAGMAPEVLARAFDTFFTTKAEGSGLGLASVKKFVDQAGGYLQVSSAVGSGTEITMLLPAFTPATIVSSIQSKRQSSGKFFYTGGAHDNRALRHATLMERDRRSARVTGERAKAKRRNSQNGAYQTRSDDFSAYNRLQGRAGS